MIFDYRKLYAASKDDASVQADKLALPRPYHVAITPDTDDEYNGVREWHDLFEAQKEWAEMLFEDCKTMSEETVARYQEIEVIARATKVIVLNLVGHLNVLERKTTETSTKYDSLIRNTYSDVDLLKSLHAGDTTLAVVGHGQDRLANLLAEKPTLKAREVVIVAFDTLMGKGNEILKSTKNIRSQIDMMERPEDELIIAAEVRRDATELLRDMMPIVAKFRSDYENFSNIGDTAQSVALALRVANAHSKSLLPKLPLLCEEMDGYLRRATATYNEAVTKQASSFQLIASFTASVTSSKCILAALQNPEDDHTRLAFNSLRFVHDLPLLYAELMAEAIHRWAYRQKLEKEPHTISDDMLAEEKARKDKWEDETEKSWQPLGLISEGIQLEFGVLNGYDTEPAATVKDLDDLIRGLKAAKADDYIISEANKLRQRVAPPPTQQRRLVMLKNGSVHQADLVKSTLMDLNDGDKMRYITGLENKVKSLERQLNAKDSQKRKLEALWRQSQSSGSISNVMSWAISPEEDAAKTIGSPSPKNGILRPASAVSRRYSSNNSADDNAFAQKLIQLESDLLAERERSAGLEKEAAAKSSAARELKLELDEATNRTDEATSIKQDLMKNLQAKQQDFDVERRALEDKCRQLEDKLEYYTDSIYHDTGSQENEKLKLNEQIHEMRAKLDRNQDEHTKLQEEISTMKSELQKTKIESERAQGQVDFLRNDAQQLRETNELLQKQQVQVQETIRELKQTADEAVDLATERAQFLRAMHSRILWDVNDDTPLAEVVEAMSSKLQDLLDLQAAYQRDVAIVGKEAEEARKQLDSLHSELTTTTEKMMAETSRAEVLREAFNAEKAKFTALEEDLASHKEELHAMMSKFADGENGSEALRSRVEEEEKKVTGLHEQLAMAQSHVTSVTQQLHSCQNDLSTSRADTDRAKRSLDGRSARAKDITHRLYSQVDRLLRLLDRLNYAINNEDGNMVITKIPRAERINNDSDASASMRRSISGPAGHPLLGSDEVAFLSWMQNDDPIKEGEQFTSYISKISAFDVEAFCDTIVKRIKDTEHTARKTTRDAKAYREKSHSAQKEAHEKIAYKHFKEGDLALFLPTRNQTTGAWAAFNVGAPHNFLKEQESHKLRSRDWLLARIQKIDDRVVDLSKSIHSASADKGSIDGVSLEEDDNPFELSDGLRWYLLDAMEEKHGIPITSLEPRAGKSTVSATNVDAMGKLSENKGKGKSAVDNISKTLSRSLDSRRSSNNSTRRGSPFVGAKRPDSVIEDSSNEAGPGRLSVDVPRAMPTEGSKLKATESADKTPTLPSLDPGTIPAMLPKDTGGLEVSTTENSKNAIVIDTLLGA